MGTPGIFLIFIIITFLLGYFRIKKAIKLQREEDRTFFFKINGLLVSETSHGYAGWLIFFGVILMIICLLFVLQLFSFLLKGVDLPDWMN